jgi:hypothetical protein
MKYGATSAAWMPMPFTDWAIVPPGTNTMPGSVPVRCSATSIALVPLTSSSLDLASSAGSNPGFSTRQRSARRATLAVSGVRPTSCQLSVSSE